MNPEILSNQLFNFKEFKRMAEENFKLNAYIDQHLKENYSKMKAKLNREIKRKNTQIDNLGKLWYIKESRMCVSQNSKIIT